VQNLKVMPEILVRILRWIKVIIDEENLSRH